MILMCYNQVVLSNRIGTAKKARKLRDSSVTVGLIGSYNLQPYTFSKYVAVLNCLVV